MTEEPSSETSYTKNETDDLQVVIENCNSISKATLSLRPLALNIKYGPNGIGKSTIARALTLNGSDDSTLDQLVPFKYRGSDDAPRPDVVGADDLKSILTFNDSYVSQFVFQPDEVLKDSFEIFINTPAYKEGLDQIDSLFEALKLTFTDEAEFESAIDSFSELKSAFSLTKSGAVAKTSKGYKALGVSSKITNIPEPLQGYSSFIQSEDPASWVSWQSKGKVYLDLSDNCPFCSAADVDKSTAELVSSEYESSAVKNMSALRTAIEGLGHYLAPSHLEQLNKITTTLTDINVEQGQFLANLRGDIDTFLRKLFALRALSFHALRDASDIGPALKELSIDLDLLPSLKSDATASVVDLINEKLDTVTQQINEVNKRVGQQRSRVSTLIKDNQNAINGFLKSAGYRYKVRIEPQDDSYRMLLEHEDAAGHHIQAASEHLSYGEKNAFALVLFMHQVQSVKPDLVVLDDPVSSFDRTKKFAILHQLFRGKNSLRGLTSLLLTHDIEPAIDIVRTGTSGKFVSVHPVVHFLSGRSGEVSEQEIKPSDIATFTEVCNANIRASSDPIIKSIYLRRRYEMHGLKNAEYNLISSLLHLRAAPTIKEASGDEREMTEVEIACATATILQEIQDFDYSRLLADLNAPGVIQCRFEAAAVGYEKLQMFRVLAELHPALLDGDDVFVKFINETYHIENEYVMQLNPRRFDAVPEYIIDACRDRIELLPS